MATKNPPPNNNKPISETPSKTQLVQQSNKPKQVQEIPQQQQHLQQQNSKNNPKQQGKSLPAHLQTPVQNKQKQPQNTPKQEDKVEGLKKKQEDYFAGLKKQIGEENLKKVAQVRVDRKTNKIKTQIENGNLSISGQIHRKGDIIEDDIIERKIMGAQKQKEQLRAQLSHLDYRLENLQSQRIDNPKSVYSHPVLKQYLETNDERKQQQASRFVRNLKSKQDEFSEKIKQKLEEIEYKKKLEEAKLQRVLLQQKQNNEKDREDRIKLQLLKIKQRNEQRQKDINEFEDIYNKKIKKDPSKRPLYQRFMKKFNNQEKMFKEKKLKDMKEKKKQYFNVAKIDFKKHEQNYFENLKKLEEQRRQNREKQFQMLSQKQPQPSLVYDSSKLLKNEITSNQFPNQIDSVLIARENAQKVVDARFKFSNALKQHQQLTPSKTKQLEMEILIDKSLNPSKYQTQIKKKSEQERYQDYINRGQLMRKNSADFTVRKSASTMSLINGKPFQTPQISSKNVLISPEDEMIFKEKVNRGFVKQEPGKERELGKLYLKSIRESSKLYMDYLRNRQSQTEASNDNDGRLTQDQISNNDQNGREDFTPNNTSPQKSTKTSEAPLKLPIINHKKYQQKANDLSNSFSNNLSNQSFQMNLIKRNSTERYNSLNQDGKQNTEPIHKPVKQNYMVEIRQKYHLDGRKEKWEKMSDQNTSLPILAKKQMLEDAYFKYDKDIALQEQIIRSHRPHELSIKEVEARQNLDSTYLKSIKAKLEMMNLTIENDEFIKKKQPKNHYLQKNEYYNQNQQNS